VEVDLAVSLTARVVAVAEGIAENLGDGNGVDVPDEQAVKLKRMTKNRMLA